jgi:hypothetical protein
LLIACGIASVAGFFIVTPGGAGGYELLMIAFLTSAGVPASASLASVLANPGAWWVMRGHAYIDGNTTPPDWSAPTPLKWCPHSAHTPHPSLCQTIAPTSS